MRRNGGRPAAHAPAARPRAAQFLDASFAAARHQGAHPAHQPRRGADPRAARAARERPGEDARTSCQIEFVGGFMRLAFLLFTSVLLFSHVNAQSYPAHAVKLIVPFPTCIAT